MCSEAVKPRDAHIEETLHRAAHELCGQRRFWRDGEGRCAGRDNQDQAGDFRQGLKLYDNRPGVLFPHGAWMSLGYLAESFFSGFGDQDVLPTLDKARCDGLNLKRCLSGAENDFREASSKMPMVVDLGKTDILVGEVP
jgi:hypothetical protein